MKSLIAAATTLIAGPALAHVEPQVHTHGPDLVLAALVFGAAGLAVYGLRRLARARA